MTRHGWIASLLYLIVFAFCLYGTAPSVSVGDSGEFITAAHTLGIPHPPGFPTYTLIGKAVSSLIPFGNPAFRSNLCSTVAGAGTVTLLFVIACQAGLGLLASGAGALLYLFSHAPLANSQVSEVFALHAFFLAAVILAAFQKQWLLAVFLMALGFGNHQTIIFLGPGLLLAFLLKLEDRPFPKSLLLALLTAGLLGMTVQAFPYLRSAHHPLLNIGQAESLDKWWRLVTRADYGTMTLALGQAPARTVANTILQLQRFGTGWLQQVSWVGIAAGLLGLWSWWRQDKLRLALVFTSFLLLGPFFFWFGNLPFDAQSRGLLERFQIAPTFCWCLLAAAGFQYLLKRSPWFAGALMLLNLGFVIPHAFATSNRQELRAYAYGRNTFHSLPPTAIFLMDGGDDTFYTTAYLTQVEHRRQDIQFYDRGGVVFPGLYGPDFRRLGLQKEARRQTVEQTLAQGARPLCYATMNPEILSGRRLEERGLLYGLQSASFLWDMYDLRGIAPWMASSTKWVEDYRVRALAPYYAYQRGSFEGARGRFTEGVSFLRSAQAVGPDVLWLTPNLLFTLHTLAYNAYKKRDYQESQQIYGLILRWNPADTLARSNHRIVAEEEAKRHAAH